MQPGGRRDTRPPSGYPIANVVNLFEQLGWTVGSDRVQRSAEHIVVEVFDRGVVKEAKDRERRRSMNPRSLRTWEWLREGGIDHVSDLQEL